LKSTAGHEYGTKAAEMLMWLLIPAMSLGHSEIMSLAVPT
jgi:hypothetical protein